MPKRCETRLYDQIKVVLRKKRLQKTPNIGIKESSLIMARYRPRCMGYSPCKMLSLGQKLKNAKKVRNSGCTTKLKLFCAKNGSKKHLILEKREQFENGQNRPRCMGYSPCKMLSLGQKLKMPKRCEKRLFRPH